MFFLLLFRNTSLDGRREVGSWDGVDWLQTRAVRLRVQEKHMDLGPAPTAKLNFNPQTLSSFFLSLQLSMEF